MKGCALRIAAVVGILVLIVWQFGEPDRRASRIQRAIRPGMSVADVEELLTGRDHCFYQIRGEDGWQSVEREDFMRRLADRSAGEPFAAKLHLWFSGISPRRATFSVQIDGSGTVTGTTVPYGWD
jgi:hypothetical protein